MSGPSLAEYIWLDCSEPVQGIRSKARVVRVPDDPTPGDFPVWSFDGSSTEQATSDDPIACSSRRACCATPCAATATTWCCARC